MNIQFIYALECPEDQVIKYVGKTKDLTVRLQGHINYALRKAHLKGKHEWIRNLKEKGLAPKMVILEQCTDETWKDRETYWIKYYSELTTLFNKTVGGEDFVFKSGNLPWNKGGGHYSEESKLKMRKAKLGGTLRPSHKAKISESSLGKKKTPEHVYNIRLGQGKPVQQWDLDGNLITEYPAATFAAEAMNCKRESIRDACRGRIKICKGFKWTFKN